MDDNEEDYTNQNSQNIFDKMSSPKLLNNKKRENDQDSYSYTTKIPFIIPLFIPFVFPIVRRKK